MSLQRGDLRSSLSHKPGKGVLGVEMNIRKLLVMSGACGTLAAAISTALAADAPEEVSETVIVTGSHIRGTAEDAALPVDVISSDDLEKQGSPTTLELLKSLPVSNGVLGDTNQFDSRAQGNEGTGSVNLRGLGRERTLVLLNGRRMVNNPFTDAVDTNIIPSAAIGRVEVLKDGAAATYGSDAIAGVVNFITKENFNGFEIGGDVKYIDGSDGDYTANATYGFQGDSFGLMVAAGYQHRSELQVLDRDWAFPKITESPEGGWSGAGNPSGYVLPSAQNQTFRDPTCAGLGGTPTGGVQTSPGNPTATPPVPPSYSFPLCNWQYTPYDNLTEEENRYQVYAETNVNFGESVEWHTEGLYAATQVPHYTTSPSYAVLQTPTSPVAGFYFVPANNPGVQAFVAQNPQITTVQGNTGSSATLIGTGLLMPGATFRPYALGGNPDYGYAGSEGRRDYEAWRVSTGVSGEVSEAFAWDVSATYMEQRAKRLGRDTVVNRLQRALMGFGGPNCSGTAPGVNGCMWFNPFGNGVPGNAITGVQNGAYTGAGDNDNEALIDWMFYEGYTQTTSQIAVADVVMNGVTGLKLPGGNLAWAFGGQYRKTKRSTELDDLTDLAITPCPNAVDGGPGCAGRPSTGPFVFLGGSYETKLEQDVSAAFTEFSLPFFDMLEMQLAARFEDYGGAVGSTFDPKVSLRVQPLDWFVLRGSYGTTFRGPPERQLDPGSVTSLQNIAGTFRAVDTFGNANLEPESATTFNVGMIINAGRLSASVDYWNFDFENPIVIEPLGGMVSAMFPTGQPNKCGAAGYGGLQSRFTFNASGCGAANIARLRVQWVNGAPVQTDGLDIGAQYQFDVGSGSLTIGANATYILNYDVDAQTVENVVVTPEFSAVGLLNYQTVAIPLPEWKGNGFLEFNMGGHNLRWTTNYIDDYQDQRTFAVNPMYGKQIDKFITHDLTYRLEMPWNTRVVFAAENITDEEPPFVRLELAYDPFTASAMGRTFKVGVTQRFGN